MAIPNKVTSLDQVQDGFNKLNKTIDNIPTGLTYNNSSYTLTLKKLDGSFLTANLMPIQPTTIVNFYVDGNNGSDITGNGSILMPFATPQWAAYKARKYSYDNSNKPVTIIVYAANYIVYDSQTINSTTVLGNLWVNGGWEFYAGSNITYTNISGTSTPYLFNCTQIQSGEGFGNCVVTGKLVINSTNGGIIQVKTYNGSNYTLDFEWLTSYSIYEFLYQDVTSSPNGTFITLRNGQANMLYDTGVPFIRCINRPCIQAYNCIFYCDTSPSGPSILFDGNATDNFGIYCFFQSCRFITKGNIAQVRIEKAIQNLLFISCRFETSFSTNRPVFLITTNITTGSALVLERNSVIRGFNSATRSASAFIQASGSVNVMAFGNNCQYAPIIADSGAALTTVSLKSSDGAYSISNTTYPSSFSTASDTTWNAAYNFWIG